MPREGTELSPFPFATSVQLGEGARVTGRDSLAEVSLDQTDASHRDTYSGNIGINSNVAQLRQLEAPVPQPCAAFTTYEVAASTLHGTRVRKRNTGHEE